VCGLAHYLEREGIPTVAIGLIARHVALIKPPRALTVPFELGRPFGAPEDTALQRRVIDRALGLLERTDGPVLETFDHPRETAGGGTEWSPPIPPAAGLSLADDAEAFAGALHDEIAALEPAFGKWSAAGGRRLDRVSGLSPSEAADLMLRLARDPEMESPRDGYSATLAVKFAADDLKHAYYQAALSQPGAPSDVEVDDWFFGGTLAGRLLFGLLAALLAAEDEAVRGFASHAFVPSHQAHRAQT
jgi:hypothetical protein